MSEEKIALPKATEILTLRIPALLNKNCCLDVLLMGFALLRTTASLFLLQPFVCRKTSGANDVWSVDIVESGITQRVSEIVVNIASELVQLDVTSVVAKGCVQTGTTSSVSVLAIVTHIIEWYSKLMKTTRSTSSTL